MANDSGESPAPAGGGKVACAAWIRRREEKGAARVFAVYGRAGPRPAIEVLGFDSKECSLNPDPLVRKLLTLLQLVRLFFCLACHEFDMGPLCVRGALQARSMLGEGPADTPRGIAVHPAGDELVCATSKGCK
jgi:prolactin regulatory element-binding protein